jgi:hypothetical protein
MFTRVSLSLSSVRRVLAAATSASTRRMKSTKFNVPLCAGVATAASLCAWQLTSPVSFGAPVLTESGHPGPMVDAVARAMPAVVRIMGRAPGECCEFPTVVGHCPVSEEVGRVSVIRPPSWLRFLNIRRRICSIQSPCSGEYASRSVCWHRNSLREW